jgi:hypothetical protein
MIVPPSEVKAGDVPLVYGLPLLPVELANASRARLTHANIRLVPVIRARLQREE